MMKKMKNNASKFLEKREEKDGEVGRAKAEATNRITSIVECEDI